MKKISYLGRTTRSVVAAGTVAISLVACTADGAGHSNIHADITWDGGEPPSGGLNDDPRAQAVREFEQWYGASRNALDFSVLDEHAAPGTAEHSHSLAEQSLRESHYSFRTSPDSVEILDIEELGSTTAMVNACFKTGKMWRVEGLDTDEPVVTEWSEENGGIVAYDVHLIDGQWRAAPNDESFASTTTSCDASNAPVATYAHQPDPELLKEVDISMLIDHEGNRVGDD